MNATSRRVPEKRSDSAQTNPSIADPTTDAIATDAAFAKRSSGDRSGRDAAVAAAAPMMLAALAGNIRS